MMAAKLVDDLTDTHSNDQGSANIPFPTAPKPTNGLNRLGKERHMRRRIAQPAALGLDMTVTPREEAG